MLYQHAFKGDINVHDAELLDPGGRSLNVEGRFEVKATGLGCLCLGSAAGLEIT